MTDSIKRTGVSGPIVYPTKPAAGTGGDPASGIPPRQTDGLRLSNPVALAAARVKAALPEGVELRVDGDTLRFSRAGTGEALYEATFKDGQWSHGGYKQHGLFGPPERKDIMKALEAGGIVQPRPAAPPPPAPAPAPDAGPVVPTPTQAGYERIAKMLGAQLPGIDVKAGPNGISFSRDGEAFYELNVRDGRWSSGGYRQHGLMGHPDSPAVREVLKQNGYGN